MQRFVPLAETFPTRWVIQTQMPPNAPLTLNEIRAWQIIMTMV